MSPPCQQDLTFIKNTILTKPTYIVEIPLRVSNYAEAVAMWGQYKKYKTIPISNTHVVNVFKFHLDCSNHVIMYHTYKDNNCLLLCKINNKFFNIIIPFINDGISIDESFIATYVPAH
jgi:hypothetical protein|tara:strand:+ start:2856 stop:3209 length:354 start_codon:yes stop_codon:yes gene_type:complete